MAEQLRMSVATRLSRYLQVARRAAGSGAESISSSEIASYTGVNATQVRRDLSSFGKFGKRGSGYEIGLLCERLRAILGADEQKSVVIVGAGRLGEALLSSQLSDSQGIEVVGIFDIDSSKIGKRIGSLSVSPLGELKQQVRRHSARGGVIAVPAQEAQNVADELVEAGVRVLFNYSEALLNVPGDVSVRTLNPGAELLSMLSRSA
ncbi:MAG: redox-sensing transcriptional repressor Rex [Gaiellaceae bacterium]